jgi:polar amino acid transport system substrate-binding protein
VRALHVRLTCCLALLLPAVSACGKQPSSALTSSASDDAPRATTGVCASYDTSTPNELSRVCATGVLRVATDQTYDADALTRGNNGRWTGFEADVVDEIAARLGVPAKIHQENPGALRSDAGDDRWDMTIGSVVDTHDNERRFDFSPPYAYTPASIAVRDNDASVQDVTTDLDGAPICVAVGSPYEAYLRGTLTLPPSAPEFTEDISSPEIVTAETDLGALHELAVGDRTHCAAVLAAWPTINRFIDTGGPVRVVGDPLFYQPLAVAFAKPRAIATPSATPSTTPSDGPPKTTPLAETVGKIIDDMRDDGTLAALSRKWYGADLTATE